MGRNALPDDFERRLVDYDAAAIADIPASVPLAFDWLNLAAVTVAWIETIAARRIAAFADPRIAVAGFVSYFCHDSTLPRGKK